MKCHESRRQLDLFMDGELSVPDNMKVLEHLNLCRACSGVYEGEKALRGALKTQLAAEPAPASVLASLGRIARGEEPGKVIEFPRRRWGAAVAAVFFALLAGTLVFTPSVVETPAAFAAVAKATHEGARTGFHGRQGPDRICLCRDCSPDQNRPMDKFFQKHVGYDVCTHELQKLGYEFTGAAVSAHRGGTVCWTVQQDGKGHSITHALVATPLALPGKPVVVMVGGRPVALAPVPDRPGYTCVFIFDDAVELDRFLVLLGMK